MLKKDIERALNFLNEEGSRNDDRRLILAVKATADAAKAHKDDLIDALTREYDASEAKRLRRGGDMVVGFLIRATSLGDRPAEADLAGLLLDQNGDVAGYYHGGEVVYPRPDDYTLRGAAVIDENAEAFHDPMEAAQAIVYGSSRRGGPYYGSRSSRY